jgi:hypothetical protein
MMAIIERPGAPASLVCHRKKAINKRGGYPVVKLTFGAEKPEIYFNDPYRPRNYDTI